MFYSPEEMLETFQMVRLEHLDVRAVTMGISLLDCIDVDEKAMFRKVKGKIKRTAGTLVQEAENIEAKYGIPIVNKRIAVTPCAILLAPNARTETACELARALDESAEDVGIDFIGGFSALCEKGLTRGGEALIEALPDVMATTRRVCSSVNVASTRAGINMDAVLRMGHIVKRTAEATKGERGIGCAKLVVFANAPEDNPFMAGASHGLNEGESTINVGISGPGVIRAAVERSADRDFRDLAEAVKRTAFKITRVGELVRRELAGALHVKFGIVDLSLAPTTATGDSVAEILEGMGLESAGAPGSTAALALLTDAVKKGGAMATSSVGGLSGAFISVSEDAGMNRAVERGSLNIEKLEAMTSVCSVGLDMICLPGDTSAETIAGIIADEMAIGVTNNKTTAVRLIPVPGSTVGDRVDFGGLFGHATIMPVSRFSCKKFVTRGGQIPRSITSIRN